MLRSADFPRDSCSRARSSTADALANELKVLWKEGGFASKSVELGVANQKIVVRTMEFPQIDEKELRAAIEFQAQEHIPIPVDEAILDYKVLSTHADDDGSVKQRILLVAAQREMVRQFVNVAKKAGLVIGGIDLQAFAMIRALAPKPQLHRPGRAADGAAAEVVALVNMGGGITNLVIAADGVTAVHPGDQPRRRDAHSGAHAAPRRSPSKRPKACASRWASPESSPISRAISRPRRRQEIHQALEQACEPFSDELRRSIDYYHTQEHVGEISKLVLTRRRCAHPQHRILPFAGAASPRRDRQPLREVGENKTKLTEVQLEWMAPRLAIAIGLALDDEG